MLVELKDRLVNLVSGFGTELDKSKHNKLINEYLHLSPRTLSAAYGTWIGGRIIDMVSEDATSKWFSVKSESLDIKPLMDRMEELELQKVITDCERWARLYGGCGGYIDIDGDDPSEPIGIIGQGQINSVVDIDRTELQPQVNISTLDVTFRKPMYYILPGGGRIHHTRVMHFTGKKVPNSDLPEMQYWGRSQLDECYDAIAMYETAVAAIKHLMHENKINIYQFENLNEMMTGRREIVRAKIEDIEKYKSMFHAIILDKSDGYIKSEIDIDKWPELLKSVCEHISSVSGISQTKLLGTPPPGLSTDDNSSERNYLSMIDKVQKKNIIPAINMLMPILIQDVYGPNADITWMMNPLHQTTAKEQINLLASASKSIKELIESGVIDQEQARQYLIDNKLI